MDERGACGAAWMCADIEARATCPFDLGVALCRGVKQCGPWLISATTGRSRMTGHWQPNGSQDAGYARGMWKVVY